MPKKSGSGLTLGCSVRWTEQGSAAVLMQVDPERSKGPHLTTFEDDVVWAVVFGAFVDRAAAAEAASQAEASSDADAAIVAAQVCRGQLDVSQMGG